MAARNRLGRRLLPGILGLVSFSILADPLPPVIETGVAPPPPQVRGEAPAARTAPPSTAPQARGDIETRLRKLERVLASGTLVRMLMRLDALQTQVARLQGTLEEQGHEIEALTRRQRELFGDIDRRLSAQEAALRALKSKPAAGQTPRPARGDKTGTTTGGPASAAAVAPVATTPKAQTARPGEPSLDEAGAYEAALALLRKRRYEQALEAFTRFLKRYPEGTYSSNAQYWVGEANYVMRHYEAAIAAFGRVVEQFPDSPKVAAAMLKMAFSHYELKHWKQARQLLETVIARFPKGSVAQLAEKRLHRMKVEGH